MSAEATALLLSSRQTSSLKACASCQARTSSNARRLMLLAGCKRHSRLSREIAKDP
jgi:hypothetical protein